MLQLVNFEKLTFVLIIFFENWEISHPLVCVSLQNEKDYIKNDYETFPKVYLLWTNSVNRKRSLQEKFESKSYEGT